MDEICSANGTTKKLNGDGSPEELSTVMIYNLGITLGLTVTDIDNMTAGEVIDLVYYRVNLREEKPVKKEESRRNATQADYDSF